MAITLVDVGSTANDGTGDPLRTAFQTVNTALTRLDNTVDVQTGYVLLKDDSGTTGVVVTTAGNAGIGTTAPGEILHTLNTSAGAATFVVHQNNSGTVSTGAGIRLAPSAFASGATIRAGEIVAVNDGTNVTSLQFKVCNGSNPATKMTIAGNGDIVMSDGTADFAVITRTGGLGYAIIGTQTAHDLVIRRNNVERVRLKSNTLNISSLPTSSAGLATGDLWNDGGTLKIA